MLRLQLPVACSGLLRTSLLACPPCSLTARAHAEARCNCCAVFFACRCAGGVAAGPGPEHPARQAEPGPGAPLLRHRPAHEREGGCWGLGGQLDECCWRRQAAGGMGCRRAAGCCWRVDADQRQPAGWCGCSRLLLGSHEARLPLLGHAYGRLLPPACSCSSALLSSRRSSSRPRLRRFG